MANSVSNVGFSDYASDQAAIDRRRQMAQALQQQSQTPIESQTAGGWVLPTSPFQGLAKMLQSYTGAKGQSDADTKQRELGQRYQSDLARTLMDASGAQATPASQIPPDPQEAQQSADYGSPQVGPATKPAESRNQAMARILMQHPATQQMGTVQMGKDIEAQNRSQMLASIMGGGQGGTQQVGNQTPGSQPNNAFAGMPPQVTALMTSGDPELVKLGTTLMEANKGIAQRPGAPVVNPYTGAVIAQPTPSVPAGVGLQVGPGGPQAYPVPGAQGAMGSLAASQAGATEAGKAPYELGTYNTQGAPTMMTREQAIQAATGQRMPQPGQPQQQQPMPQGLPPNVPREDAPAFQYVQDQARRGRTASAYGNSSAPQQAGLRLQDQGESASQQHAGAEVGKFFGDTYAQLQRGAMDASGKLTRLTRMESLLKDVETGKLTPAGTNIAAYAKSVGIDIDPNLDNKQAAEALTNEIALQARNPSGGAGMPGALSDSDRNFLSSMTPGLAKTPGAREMIMETSRKLAQRDQEVAKLARNYFKEHGNTLDNGFFDELQNFSHANPLFKDSKTPATPANFNEGQTASGPGGQKVVFRGGQWVPIGR